jgi:hypothetical protein
MKLDKFDLINAIKRLPAHLLEVVKQDDWQGKVFIGGGYLRAIVAQEPINDIDVFVSTKVEAELLARKLCSNSKNLYETVNAYTVKRKIPIQIIHRWLFEEPEDVANSFDFTVCCAIISYANNGWDSYCDDRFYTDVASKRLVYRQPIRNEDAGGSMLRVLKYYQKGYRIPLASLGAVIARLIKDLDVNKIGGLKNEEEVARILTGLLVEVDPNNVMDECV